jgi:hypothetical protein
MPIRVLIWLIFLVMECLFWNLKFTSIISNGLIDVCLISRSFFLRLWFTHMSFFSLLIIIISSSTHHNFFSDQFRSLFRHQAHLSITIISFSIIQFYKNLLNHYNISGFFLSGQQIFLHVNHFISTLVFYRVFDEQFNELLWNLDYQEFRNRPKIYLQTHRKKKF